MERQRIDGIKGTFCTYSSARSIMSFATSPAMNTCLSACTEQAALQVSKVARYPFLDKAAPRLERDHLYEESR